MGDKLNILVVGNGFDIAHGLPTRYTDFLEFLKLLKYQNDKKSQKWLLEKSKFPKELFLCICGDIPTDGKRLRAVLDIGEIHGVLSFNYTDTFYRLYAKPLGMNPQYCYIHGQAKEADDISICNMVLGIDEYLSEDDRNKNVEFVGFKKYYQRIFKQTDYNYTEWFDGTKPINLYIIGHSLDITDKDVLSDILLHKEVKSTIFYHDKQANGTQISNLVKVLGYDNLNMLTRGRDPHRSIIFSQLLLAEQI